MTPATDECRPDERAAEQAGKSYYKAVNELVSEGGARDGRRRKTFILARAYYRALDVLRKCLDRIRSRPDAARKLKHTVELQELLEQDMRILGGTPDPLPSAADES